MRQIPNEPKRGPAGKAEVIIIGKKARITFTDGDYVGQEFEFDTASLPAKVDSGEYAVRLSADSTKVFGIAPLNATVMVKFLKFTSAPNQPPAPKRKSGTRQGRNGPYPFDELTFTALGKVISRNYKDMEIAMPFLYPFIADDDGMVAIKGTGAKQQKVSDFIRCAYGGELSLKFSDNILPTLQAILQKRDNPFMVTMKDGWPDSYAEPIDAKPRKTTAKAPVKTKAKAKKK